MEDRIEIDVNDLTLGDLEDIESVVGTDTMRLVMKGEVTPKAMVALVWVAMRQTDPGFSLDDARKVNLKQFSFGGADIDPFGGDGTSSTSPPSP